jgi:uncharacterized protein YqgC (DUF456 family)
MEPLGTAVIGLVMLVGLAGTVVPLLPGLPLIWGAGLIYGLLTGFDAVGWTAMAVLTLLLVLGVAAKYILSGRKAAAGGAPAYTMLAGALFGIIGFFVVPVIGLVLGAAAGILAAERLRTGDWGVAGRSTRDVLVAYGIGTAIEFAAGVLMIGAWVGWLALSS